MHSFTYFKTIYKFCIYISFIEWQRTKQESETAQKHFLCNITRLRRKITLKTIITLFALKTDTYEKDNSALINVHDCKNFLFCLAFGRRMKTWFAYYHWFWKQDVNYSYNFSLVSDGSYVTNKHLKTFLTGKILHFLVR